MNIQGCHVFHSFIPCFSIYLFKLFTIIFLLLIFYYDRAGSCSGPGLVALWQCGILVTCPGIGPAWRVGWTTREVPSACLLSAPIGSLCDSEVQLSPPPCSLWSPEHDDDRGRTSEPLCGACPPDSLLCTPVHVRELRPRSWLALYSQSI